MSNVYFSLVSVDLDRFVPNSTIGIRYREKDT